MASNKDHDEFRARELKVAMNDFIESPDPETLNTTLEHMFRRVHAWYLHPAANKAQNGAIRNAYQRSCDGGYISNETLHGLINSLPIQLSSDDGSENDSQTEELQQTPARPDVTRNSPAPTQVAPEPVEAAENEVRSNGATPASESNSPSRDQTVESVERAVESDGNPQDTIHPERQSPQQPDHGQHYAVEGTAQRNTDNPVLDETVQNEHSEHEDDETDVHAEQLKPRRSGRRSDRPKVLSQEFATSSLRQSTGARSKNRPKSKVNSRQKPAIEDNKSDGEDSEEEREHPMLIDEGETEDDPTGQAKDKVMADVVDIANGHDSETSSQEEDEEEEDIAVQNQAGEGEDGAESPDGDANGEHDEDMEKSKEGTVRAYGTTKNSTHDKKQGNDGAVESTVMQVGVTLTSASGLRTDRAISTTGGTDVADRSQAIVRTKTRQGGSHIREPLTEENKGPRVVDTFSDAQVLIHNSHLNTRAWIDNIVDTYKLYDTKSSVNKATKIVQLFVNLFGTNGVKGVRTYIDEYRVTSSAVAATIERAHEGVENGTEVSSQLGIEFPELQNFFVAAVTGCRIRQKSAADELVNLTSELKESLWYKKVKEAILKKPKVKAALRDFYRHHTGQELANNAWSKAAMYFISTLMEAQGANVPQGYGKTRLEWLKGRRLRGDAMEPLVDALGYGVLVVIAGSRVMALLQELSPKHIQHAMEAVQQMHPSSVHAFRPLEENVYKPIMNLDPLPSEIMLERADDNAITSGQLDLAQLYSPRVAISGDGQALGVYDTPPPEVRRDLRLGWREVNAPYGLVESTMDDVPDLLGPDGWSDTDTDMDVDTVEAGASSLAGTEISGAGLDHGGDTTMENANNGL